MRYPPGLIGLACGEISRYSDFLPSIVGLQKPAGTFFQKISGLGPAQPFNNIAALFLENKSWEWLFLVNDDHIYPPDTIVRLLNREVDVVSGLYFGRLQPFEPILFDKVELIEDPNNPGRMRNWYTRHLMQPGEEGLIQAAAVGDGCLLIRRHVLEKMQPPWWEYGETFSDACDHDVVFSRKVREAGFGLYCDLDVRVDHIASFAVRPVRKADGTWVTQLVQSINRALEVPAPSKG